MSADNDSTNDSSRQKYVLVFAQHGFPDQLHSPGISTADFQRQHRFKATGPVVGHGNHLHSVLLIYIKINAVAQFFQSPGNMVAKIRRAVASAPHGHRKLAFHPHPGKLFHLCCKSVVNQKSNRLFHLRAPEFLRRLQMQRILFASRRKRIPGGVIASGRIGIGTQIPQGFTQAALFLCLCFKRRIFSSVHLY